MSAGRYSDLRRDLEMVWSPDTAAAGTTAGPPSRGQCAVTALIVQELYGGDLLRVLVDGESHYWNRLPDGTEVDLTRDQFPAWVVNGEPEARERGYLLANPDTAKRYRLLKSRLGQHWWE